MNLPVMKSDSHILPLFIGNPVQAKTVSDLLLSDYNIYAQPINYPTVPKGEERLRISPSPVHTEQMIDDFVGAAHQIWNKLGLRLLADYQKDEKLRDKFFSLPDEGNSINIDKSHLYYMMDDSVV